MDNIPQAIILPDDVQLPENPTVEELKNVLKIKIISYETVKQEYTNLINYFETLNQKLENLIQEAEQEGQDDWWKKLE